MISSKKSEQLERSGIVARPSVFVRSLKGAGALCTLALLAACPGSDIFDDVGNDPQSRYTVSGTMTLAQNSAIDSDTNDPNQVDRKDNNVISRAQVITNPTQVVGYLNVAGQGPDGPSRSGGDLSDAFKTRLQTGQTVEVQFAADPSTIDVDLFIFDSNNNVVGQSVGQNSYECIQVSSDGDYTVGTLLFTQNGASRGGTVYQMRIGAPGASADCQNATSANASVIPGQVIAQRQSETVLTKQSKAVKAAALPTPVTLKGSLAEPRSALLEVPRDAAGFAASSGLTKSAAESQLPEWTEELSQNGRSVIETIIYAKALSRSGEYLYAEPNTLVQAFQVTAFPPNDQEYSKQRWHYDSIDLSGAINLIAASNPASTYTPIVAVIDSGIVANHPDLQNQLVPGYDFIRDAARAGDGGGIDSNPDDADNSTTNVFHGTHVAGTVAAQTGNQIGGAGVAPMAKIMPIRALGQGGGSFYDIEQSVRFAAGLANDSRTTPARKADVMNLSLGGAGACSAAGNTLFAEVRQANVIVAIATGNSSTDSRLVAVGTPANCPNVIGIGATNPSKGRSYYSNGGAGLDAVAPGGDVRRSTTGTGLPDGVFSTVANANGSTRTSTYGMLQGTSMASPHAAGIFALMRHIAPGITPAQVDDAIANGSIVDDLGAGGRDNSFGFGQLNARKAVEFARQVAGAPPPNPGQVSAQPTSVAIPATSDTSQFELRAAGTASETVVSVTASTNAISVAPGQGVDGDTGLGSYVITVNRNNLTANAETFSKVIVTLNPQRELEIPVSVTSSTVGGGSGDLGPIYVLIVDADNRTGPAVVQTTVRQPSNGEYRYQIEVPGTRNIIVLAGSDTDNDGSVCNRGEACGAYPLLGNNQTEVLTPTGNLTEIDFSLAPFGGINPQSLTGPDGEQPTAAATNADAPLGIRRLDQ